MSQVEERLAKLGHKVPDPGTPKFNYLGAVKTGNLVFVAGHALWNWQHYLPLFHLQENLYLSRPEYSLLRRWLILAPMFPISH